MTFKLLLFFIGVIGVTATQYDPDLAMTGWTYSKAAFCTPADLMAWNCTSCAVYNPGMGDVAVFDSPTTEEQAFVGYNKLTQTIVMSFRGSDNLPNWIYDLDFFYTAYPNAACNNTVGLGPKGEGCQVHRGFLDVYQSVQQGVFEHASELFTQYTTATSKPKLLVTGHSLGAAVAILAGVDATLQFLDKASDIAIYTFGEPRVGNPQWALWASEHVIPGGKQYRVTHEADPVPRLPPYEWGFLHVPHEVWYNNDLAGNAFTVCNDNATAEDYTNCENSQTALVPEDHLLYLGIHAGCGKG